MADVTTASIIPLNQPPARPKSGAERQRAYKARLKAQKAAIPAVISDPEPVTLTKVTSPVTLPTAGKSIAPLALRAAALGLAGVGLSMNAMFARSLGSSDLLGWLFLALGLCADCAALALPSVAASAWKLGERTTAAAAWVTWAVVFAFALLGSVGFASTSIADVTQQRANRSSPAIVTAQAALSDAMAARDRECKGGVGRFCRQREDAATEARHALDVAASSVANGADPQVAAMSRLLTWVSRGTVSATEADIGMVRLLLLALLPQIGGILLMIAGRRA